VNDASALGEHDDETSGEAAVVIPIFSPLRTKETLGWRDSAAVGRERSDPIPTRSGVRRRRFARSRWQILMLLRFGTNRNRGSRCRFAWLRRSGAGYDAALAIFSLNDERAHLGRGRPPA